RDASGPDNLRQVIFALLGDRDKAFEQLQPVLACRGEFQLRPQNSRLRLEDFVERGGAALVPLLGVSGNLLEDGESLLEKLGELRFAGRFVGSGSDRDVSQRDGPQNNGQTLPPGEQATHDGDLLEQKAGRFNRGSHGGASVASGSSLFEKNSARSDPERA